MPDDAESPETAGLGDDTGQALPSAHPAPREGPGACWLCGDLGGIAIHIVWSERRGKPLWTAHEYPSGDPHPVEPCPVCASAERERAVAAEGKLAAITEHCRTKANWFDGMVGANRILAIIGTEGDAP